MLNSIIDLGVQIIKKGIYIYIYIYIYRYIHIIHITEFNTELCDHLAGQFKYNHEYKVHTVTYHIERLMIIPDLSEIEVDEN